jgi:hypothetical protein
MPDDDAAAAAEAAAAAAPPPPPPQAVVVHPYTAVNVKTHIRVTLEMKNPNFTKWASFFKALCGKFSLRPHIDGPPPGAGDPSWDIAECIVRGWILNTVADSVLDLALTDENQSAHELWVAIEGLFRSNRAPRVVFLLEEFHSLKQGDSTIDEYCQRLKVKAAALRDIDETIEDARLVLSLLRSLNPRYSGIADDIANSAVLPSFSRAREMLSLKELHLANDEKTTAAFAMVAASGSTCTSTGCRSFLRCSHQCSSQGLRGWGQQERQRQQEARRLARPGQRQQRLAARQQCPNRGQPPQGTMVLLQPMGFPGRCSFRWQQGPKSGSWQQGSQGGRNQGLMGANPQAHFAAPPPPSPVWDQVGLIAALNQMALQNSGWVMDSSATSHMHNTDGILLSRQPSFVPSVTVGNGHHLPVSCSGTSTLPGSTSSFSLRNVLVVPSLVRNLLLVRQFTRDNNCTIEFDAFGFSVKDLQTRHVILRSNSSDDLYTVPATPQANLATSTNLWHHRLGHIQELLP